MKTELRKQPLHSIDELKLVVDKVIRDTHPTAPFAEVLESVARTLCELDGVDQNSEADVVIKVTSDDITDFDFLTGPAWHQYLSKAFSLIDQVRSLVLV